MIIKTNDIVGYNSRRNFVALPFKKAKVEECFDLFKIPNAIYFRMLNKSNKFFLFSHSTVVKSSALHHFFNALSFSRQPWIVSFETALPRWGRCPGWLEQEGVKLLANDHCKKIIAISQSAYNIQLKYLDKFPRFKNQIENKMVVLHPAQHLLIDSYDEKELDELITFSLIGGDFFRKGGKEVLVVFDKLLEEGYPIKLQIVSKLDYGDYASQTTKNDFLEAVTLIEKNSSSIIWYKTLPNTAVLDMLKKSHIALLPTYADTYGYSVLEAQAAGCPVITTDIRALPEINNNECGWVINVPKDELGNGIIDNREERELLSKTIIDNLHEIILTILKNKEIIRMKGEASINKIKRNHNPILTASLLESIYQEALN
ncbi:glycosyltransferase family 4 protein [uncultured Pontibacter sp.]|uniref:glycosyltransferase family 4 protein n=1 Tax=uncultured Pontibacter sp. TaxID=453356 RepID=UPI002629F5C9|nr:glycosyltransferase family 4 protein [uncultured Pontibacter sp.]